METERLGERFLGTYIPSLRYNVQAPSMNPDSEVTGPSLDSQGKAGYADSFFG